MIMMMMMMLVKMYILYLIGGYQLLPQAGFYPSPFPKPQPIQPEAVVPVAISAESDSISQVVHLLSYSIIKL